MQGVMLEGLAPFRHEQGVRQGIVVPVCPPLGIVAQAIRRAGMERHNAGFVELCLEDVQLRRLKIELDVPCLEAEGFAHPHTGAGEEANQGR
jgi:hypothetical protein